MTLLTDSEHAVLLDRLHRLQSLLNRLVGNSGSLLEIADVLMELRAVRLQLLEHHQSVARVSQLRERTTH